MFDFDGRPVGEEDQEGLLEVFQDFEKYVAEKVYGLTEQGTDKSMADTIAGFLQTQA